LHLSSLPEFIRSNLVFIRLAVQYARGAKERKFVRDLLGQLVREVLESSDMDLETDPAVVSEFYSLGKQITDYGATPLSQQVHKMSINAEESRTGVQSARQLDVDAAGALLDTETRTAFIRSEFSF
jgi:Ras GTPase-activating-like protein IQGAP2/3